MTSTSQVLRIPWFDRREDPARAQWPKRPLLPAARCPLVTPGSGVRGARISSSSPALTSGTLQGAVVDVEPVLGGAFVGADGGLVGLIGIVEDVLGLVDSAPGVIVDVVEEVGGEPSVVSCVVVVVTGTRTAGTSSVGGGGVGRTPRYRASVRTKAPESTSVDVRGRPLIARRIVDHRRPWRGDTGPPERLRDPAAQLPSDLPLLARKRAGDEPQLEEADADALDAHDGRRVEQHRCPGAVLPDLIADSVEDVGGGRDVGVEWRAGCRARSGPSPSTGW